MSEEEGDDAEVEGGDWGGGLLALKSTGILNQDADPGGTTLIDACNGFNELSCLAMIWTVHHRCPAGASFALNCYRYWAQILLW